VSEESKRYRAEMKAKARRLGGSGDPHQKVDASSWEPPPAMNTEAPTGPRPVSKRRNYKRGGLVEGAEARHHAGRRPRKAGGKALVNDWVNNDVKEANEDRDGIKHEGGMKRGGRTKKAGGGGLGVLGPMAGIIPSLIASQMGGNSTPAPYSPGTPGQPAGKTRGGRAHRDAGGPLAGPLSEGIGGEGRMNFAYPAAKSPAQSLGLKTGGKVKGHPEGCMCDRCKGGRVERAEGGRLYKEQFSNHAGDRNPRARGGKLDARERNDLPKSDFGEPGSRKYPMPDKGHAANAKARASQQEHKGHISKSTEEKIDAKADRVLGRKDGGRAGKGKMSVNIVIAPGHPQQPAMGAMPPPPSPSGPPLPMPPRPPSVLPVGVPTPGMGAAAPMMPPGGAPPPMGMGRKRGGLVDGGAGGGLGRLEKIKDYGDNAWEAEERR
jgi:hypothetical protein